MKNYLNNNFRIFLLLSGLFLVILNLTLLVFINTNTVFSYIYTFILFIIAHYIIAGKNFLLKNLFVFQFYVLLAISLYLAHLIIMPDWKGFSGTYRVGTDDSSFYAALTNNISSIPFPAQGYMKMEHSFITFLRILYPFSINHPLTIIIPNLLGIVFIPFFTYNTSLSFNSDTKISKVAFILVLICPVILSNGLILMRDGWTAFLTIAGLYYLVEKKIIPFLFILALLSFIRLGSGLLLAIIPIFYFSEIIFSGSFIQKTVKIGTIIFSFLLLLFLGIPFIMDYLITKGVSGLARQEFVETFIRAVDSESMIYKIYTLPVYLKLPLGFIFFLLLPFLNLQFYTEGILNIRHILFTTIMPILSIIYFRYFISGLIYVFNNKDKLIRKLFIIYGFLLLVISQISLQPRHKTAVMPLFYILVAYGIFNNNRISREVGLLFAIFLAIVQIYFLV